MARVAFYTFGILREAHGHPQVQGFFDRIPDVFAGAEATDGYVDRRRGDRPAEFGPRFFDPAQHAGAPQTLSVWRDLESVYAFAYRGRHGEALRGRREWAVEPQWPTYVAWWVDDEHMPTWQEAAERLEHLHDHGSTPFAFSFKAPFDVSGQPLTIDRARVAERAATVP
jgi:hypothetical protein